MGIKPRFFQQIGQAFFVIIHLIAGKRIIVREEVLYWPFPRRRLARRFPFQKITQTNRLGIQRDFGIPSNIAMRLSFRINLLKCRQWFSSQHIAINTGFRITVSGKIKNAKQVPKTKEKQQDKKQPSLSFSRGGRFVQRFCLCRNRGGCLFGWICRFGDWLVLQVIHSKSFR